VPRAVSIHIGVNEPQDCLGLPPLKCSEASAFRMAELADQAGFDQLLVLRGSEATHQAVDDALAGASRTLRGGDTLFVSFSGHGTLVRDRDGDERDGWDEAWCLHDGTLLDDKLAGFWRLFEAGVRIVVVAESCFGGGTMRDGDALCAHPPAPAPARVMRSGPVFRGGAEPEQGAAPCIADPPRNADGIQASILLLAACAENLKAGDGLYTQKLLEVWSGGDFAGSYCKLHAEVSRRVTRARVCQVPQILMLGAPDLAFPLETAFHRRGRTVRSPPRRGMPQAPRARGFRG
jgi:hypothetical protein